MSTTSTIQVPGVRGATRRSWRSANPRELLTKIINDNPRMTDAELLEAYRDAVRENEAYLDAVIEAAFVNDLGAYRRGLRNAAVIARGWPPAGDRIHRPVAAEAKKAAAATFRGTVEKVVERKAQIIMLDLVMPNGKALRDCTGKDCKELGTKVGAWLTALGGKLKSAQKVGDVLSEAQVRALYAK